MFISQLLKECKLISKSIIYYILSICIITFVLAQMGSFDLKKPEPSDKYFGYVTSTNKPEIMRDVTTNLEYQYQENKYSTYPFGFIKYVKLDDANKKIVGDILEKINKKEININDENDYEEFLKDMDKIDEIIGGGSYFNSEKIKKTSVKATYEQALDRYNKILEEDHVSDALARNFGDYMGIELSILPVFLAVYICLRDKKAKSEQVIYSSKSSAASIIIARYLAVVLMIMISVVIMAFFQDTQCIYFAKNHGITPNYLAFTKCILGWLLPSVMISSAVGFFFTELMKNVGGIFIQLIWWFVSLLTNKELTGGVGYNLIPRFNSFGYRSVFLSVYNELIINRIIYFSISVILVILTIYIYDYRRHGGKIGGKILSIIKG